MNDGSLEVSDAKRVRRPKLLMKKELKDRRVTWYSLNEEVKGSVNSQVRRYRVEEFLDGMEEPNSHESTKEEGDLKITFSLFAEAKGKKAEWPEKDLENVFPSLEPLGSALMKRTHAEKIGIFVGYEKQKEGAKP